MKESDNENEEPLIKDDKKDPELIITTNEPKKTEEL